MKKIIDGERFDISQAVLIGRFVASNLPRELRFSFDVYRKPRVEKYFLYGQGGALSRFAQSAGRNNFKSGKDIIPITKNQAKSLMKDFNKYSVTAIII